MTKNYTFRSVSRINLLDPKYKLLHKLNAFALIAIVIGSGVGGVLNYVFRCSTHPGGAYLIYMLLGVVACLIYPYLHEFAHGAAIICTKGKAPTIKFGKLAATCGSSDIIFTKPQYYFVVSFPFLFFCAALIPTAILIPPQFFPIPFMPLCYNVFGSVADFIMIHATFHTPKGSIIIDEGTEAVVYAPITQQNI